MSTSSTSHDRGIRRLAAAPALVALLALLAATITTGARAATTTPSVAKIVALHEAMDELWTDHVAWTRTVIVDFDSNAPDLSPDLARLLQNQVDIGNAIKAYYGAAAGDELTRLLHTHILEAVPILTYAKNGDRAKLRRALATWYANGHQIAAFLAKANPRSWPLAAMTTMMDNHLKLTTDEAVAHLKHQWTADIADYDAVRAEILSMANTLANGIISQFPARFVG